jgi:hypothetical protein
MIHMNSGPPVNEDKGHIVRFRHRRSAELPGGAPSPDDLAKYQHTGADDDYRHRMLVNGVAFVFIVLLIGAGLWIADTMAQMRKNQDCVLSGRRGCSPVEFSHDRW